MIQNPKEIISIIKEAGKIANDYFTRGLIISTKEDGSEVSNADIEVSNFIIENLRKVSPYAIISEEFHIKEDFSSGNFWLIDPIDGTSSFINRKESFVINIALIKNFIPVQGFIYIPTEDKLFYNINNKKSFYEQGSKIIELKKFDNPKELVAAISYRESNLQLENFLNKNKISKIINIPSGIKFCMLIENKAQIYPRYGLTMEWDIAAGHAMLKTLGGNILDLQGEEIKYGKQDFKNSHFIALSDSLLFKKLEF